MFGSAFGKQYGLRRDAPCCLCAEDRGDVPVGRSAPRREVSGLPLPELAEAFGRRGRACESLAVAFAAFRRVAAVARYLSCLSGESARAPISCSRHRPAHMSPSRNTTTLIPAPSMIFSRPVSPVPLAGEPRAPRPYICAPPAFASACRPPSGSRGSARTARYRKTLDPLPPRMVSTGRFGTRGAANA